MLERITFNTAGWHEHKRSNEWVVWGKAGGILSVAVIPPAWIAFKRMKREYFLGYARKMAKPGGIVSVDSCTAADRPGIQIIYKREEGSGYRYTGILVIDFGEQWYQITVVCGETGLTGIREAVLTAELMDDGIIGMKEYPFYIRLFKRSSGYVQGWFTDPYDSEYKGIVLRSVADDEKYDSQFPDHPLSRLRSTLKTVRESLQLSQ